MKNLSDDLLRAHHVYVPTDDVFQRRARLLQALWREERELPIGAKPNGELLGSRLAMPFGKESLANFMSEGARAAVRAELGASKGAGKLIEENRLYANLLSSQPLCFNLFGELQADLALASAVFRSLFAADVSEVTAVRFEHSPGRGDARFTGDRSAFDVFVEHTRPEGGRGFLGIEVKYHEGLDDAPSTHKERYDEIAKGMACFVPEKREALLKKPIQQMWRDHLLAGAMLQGDSTWTSGRYVFLHAGHNARCVRAAELYGECLADARTFVPLTLERIVEVVRAATNDARWALDVEDRYLGFTKLDGLLE